MTQESQAPKKSILTSSKLVFTAPAPGQQFKKATLSFDAWNGDANIKVMTNDPNDTINYGMIRAGLDLFTFAAFLDMLESAPTWEPKTKKHIDCIGKATFADGKRTPGSLLNKVFVGKDENGVIYVSVIDCQNQGRAMLKFDILTPNREKFHAFHSNGQPMNPAEESASFARGTARVLQTLMPMLANNTYTPPVFNKNGGGKGGGGGYNKSYGGSSNGGGWNKNQNQQSNGTAMPDSGGSFNSADDIPF